MPQATDTDGKQREREVVRLPHGVWVVKHLDAKRCLAELLAGKHLPKELR